jgi:hypothetical protein
MVSEAGSPLLGVGLVVIVNTKIWYRKESDLWAQLGEKIRPVGKGARGRQFVSVRQGDCLR